MKKSDAITLLQRGNIGAWNEYRNNRGRGWVPDIAGNNFKAGPGINLSNANLSGCTITGSLYGANLRNANLTNATFQLEDSGLSEADLSDANLRGADLSACNNLGSAASWKGAKYDIHTRFPDNWPASTWGTMFVSEPDEPLANHVNVESAQAAGFPETTRQAKSGSESISPAVSRAAQVNGDAIRRLRLIKTMTQQDLAMRSNLSIATIARLELGRGRVQPHTLRSIAHTLGVDAHLLLAAPDMDGNDAVDPELATPSLSVKVTPYFHKRDLVLEEDLAFVLMPFSEPWSHYIWSEEIKPIVAGIADHPLRCLRADDLYGHDVMIDVYESIAAARIIIAEITGRNANVFYELGIAHTLGKEVILLAQGKDHIPFDLLRFRHCIYANNGPGYKILREYLKKAISSILQN